MDNQASSPYPGFDMSAPPSASAPPASASGHDMTNSVYKRKRSSKACVSCRQKKVKCSGNMPCQHCQEFGEVCGFEDANMLSSTSRTVFELQSRMARLEAYILSTGAQLPPIPGLPAVMDRVGLPEMPNTAGLKDSDCPSPAPSGVTEGRKRQKKSAKAEEGSMVSVASSSSASSMRSECSTTQSTTSVPSTRAQASPTPTPVGGIGTEDDILENTPQPSSQQLRQDRKGHLRYLGPASTSSVVAEISDRQLWDGSEQYRRPGAFTSSSRPWGIFSNLGISIAGALPPLEDVGFPPDDLATTLLESYFDILSPIFPVLHKTFFIGDYWAMRQKHISKANPIFLCLVFAVFACGSLVVYDSRVTVDAGYSDAQKPDPKTGLYNFGLAPHLRAQGIERPGANYYAKSHILLQRAIAEPSLDLTIFYGLISFYHVASDCSARAWVLCGQALRLAIEIGLHRSSTHFKPVARERRRRAFWALYSLEGLLAANLGRPPSLPEDEIDQEYPEDVDMDTILDAQPRNSRALRGFLYTLVIHRMSAEALRTINRYHRGLDRENDGEARFQSKILEFEATLNDWYDKIPEDFLVEVGQLTPIQQSQRLVMTALHPTVQLLLFMPLLPQKSHAPTQFEVYALSRCIMASKDLILLAKSFASSVPPSHYCHNYSQHLLVAGALLLLLCYRGLESREIFESTLGEVDFCIQGLHDIGKVFIGGKIAMEMLVRMRDNLKRQCALGGMQLVMPPGPSTLHNLLSEPFQTPRAPINGSHPRPSHSPVHATSSHGQVFGNAGPQQGYPFGTPAAPYPQQRSSIQDEIAWPQPTGTVPYAWPSDSLGFHFSGLDDLAAMHFAPGAAAHTQNGGQDMQMVGNGRQDHQTFPDAAQQTYPPSPFN